MYHLLMPLCAMLEELSKWGLRHQPQGYLTRHEAKADNWIDRREEPCPWENAVVPNGQKVRHLHPNWAAEAAEIEAAINPEWKSSLA
jgi:hypothetical protein